MQCRQTMAGRLADGRTDELDGWMDKDLGVQGDSAGWWV